MTAYRYLCCYLYEINDGGVTFVNISCRQLVKRDNDILIGVDKIH